MKIIPEYPLINNNSVHPNDSACPICQKKFNCKFVCFNAGALLQKDNGATMDENMIGFGVATYHNEDECISLYIADNAVNGQFEIYACSIDCMKKIFEKYFDKLKEMI